MFGLLGQKSSLTEREITISPLAVWVEGLFSQQGGTQGAIKSGLAKGENLAVSHGAGVAARDKKQHEMASKVRC